MINTNKEQGELPKEVQDIKRKYPHLLTSEIEDIKIMLLAAKDAEIQNLKNGISEKIITEPVNFILVNIYKHLNQEQIDSVIKHLGYCTEAEISDLKAKNNKLMELLKEEYALSFKHPLIKVIASEQGLTSTEYLAKKWAEYCTENGLNEGE